MTQPTEIEAIIRRRIASSPAGWLSFAEVMELALYHPEHGYYAGNPVGIGRGGDFFTAVSVGPLYGGLLARLADRVWNALGKPEDFFLIEQAAHDGQLMADVLAGLGEIQSALRERCRVIIVEPQPAYRDAQKQRLGPLLGDRISWVGAVDELRGQPRTAFFFANELLDAMPVHRVRWSGACWMESVVTLAEGRGGAFAFRDVPVTGEELIRAANALPCDLPAGFTTEINLATLRWADALRASALHGCFFIADYGLDHDEFFIPSRREGTLRRYHEHQMDGDVLSELGRCDLTAHVNFTQLIARLCDSEMKCLAYSDQGRFLTRLAAPWLRSLEGRAPGGATAALLRQFQTLTHPAHMGSRFRVCLLGRGMSASAFADLIGEEKDAN